MPTATERQINEAAIATTASIGEYMIGVRNPLLPSWMVVEMNIMIQKLMRLIKPKT
jgi:hypothetical protein